MKIVATIEVPLSLMDEESKSAWNSLEMLKNNPQQMIDLIYDALDGALDFGIHSPRIEEGDI